MKKILFFVLVVSLVLFSSCGMSWENTKKGMASDWGGGLSRSIVVKNQLTGEVEWTFDGIAYIDDNSSAGDVTIVYKENGEVKKADFLGKFYGVKSIEK